MVRNSFLKPRDPNRRLIITEAAQFYGISSAKLYRELRQHNKPKAAYRTDYNQPRLTTFDEMRRYCELIAALKLRTTNKKGRHLSTKECIRLLENYGVETPEGLVKIPTGFLKKSTVSVYLKRFGLDPSSLTIQPTVVRFQAEQSNACWHFDFSSSDFKYFPDDQKKSRTEHPPSLMIASVVDDRSGVTYIVNTVHYQLSNELAGLTVTLLWGLFDNELHVEYDGQQYGPFYPAKGPIPLGQYRSFKKSSREKQADYIGELAKKISLPSNVLGTQDKTTEQLLTAAGLAQEKLSCVPFNSLETNTGSLFKNTIEAKAAIARWLGFPLGQLQPEQITQIDAIVTATLEKQIVMSRIKQLFELRLIAAQQEER